MTEHAGNKANYGQLLFLMTINSQLPNGKRNYKLLPPLTFPPERISILDFMNVELVPEEPRIQLKSKSRGKKPDVPACKVVAQLCRLFATP